MDIIATSRPAPPGAGSLVESAIDVAARLDLAGYLSGGPGRVADLALATGTHGPSLHRLLRALACARLFDEVEPGVFALAPQSAGDPGGGSPGAGDPGGGGSGAGGPGGGDDPSS